MKSSKVYGFKNNTSTFKISPNKTNEKSIDHFLRDAMKFEIDILTKEHERMKSLKAYNGLEVIMNKQVMKEHNELVFKAHKVQFIGEPFEVINTLNLAEKIHWQHKNFIRY